MIVENFTYENANNLILEYVPEVTSAAEKEKEWWGDEKIPETVFYEDVLGPYVREILREDKNIPAIKRVFDFYEKMATSEDKNFRNLVQVCMLEPLWGDKVLYLNALKYMHSNTRVLFDELHTSFRSPFETEEETEKREKNKLS